MRIGENIIHAKVAYKQSIGLESVYLVGIFGVRMIGNIPHLVCFPSEMGCGELWKFDLPFYSGNLRYEVTPQIYSDLLPKNCGKDGRILLLPEFYGACAVVKAKSGEQVIAWDSAGADITEAVSAKESIWIQVDGTRRNLFGSFHQNPIRAGGYGPGNFVTDGAEWSNDYHLWESGLKSIRFLMQKTKEDNNE